MRRVFFVYFLIKLLTLVASRDTFAQTELPSDQIVSSAPLSALPLAQDVQAAEPLTSNYLWPETLLLPWRIIGIDENRTAAARQSLQNAWDALAQKLMQNPQTVTSYLKTSSDAGSTQPSLNRARRLDQILAGAARTPLAMSVAVEPVWCSVLNYDVFFVTIADAKRNALLGSAHAVYERPSDFKSLRADSKTLVDKAGAKLTALAEAAQAAASSKAPSNDALHLGLALGHNLTRKDEGDSACLTLLLEEVLAKDYTVARAHGSDQLATVRDALQYPPALRRPTRAAVLRWQLPNDGATPRVLPQTYTLTASFVETVFGQSIPTLHKSAWTLTPNNEQLTFTVDPGFKQVLDEQKTSLSHDDWPQVVKVYGAWVYLDRGRAWGLKMRDRLLATVNGEPVKGHVVRFFGPEAGLRSPRGFPIQEGAILYIRKGQRLTRPGLEFRYDERRFPTPWPPQPSP